MVEVARMERVLKSRQAKRFLQRVFSDYEIAACRASARPAQGFAARFAAKEAVSKALGAGFTRGVTPGSIVVRGGDRERPIIVLKDRALEFARSLGVSGIHTSLTHTRETACAFVTVESGDPDGNSVEVP
jgi:holo-[acyl-carrier protein] synthase